MDADARSRPRLSILKKELCRLRKLHETQTAPLRCRIALAQAIPKGKNMELIVQKAVELGAAEIFPIISERTIVDLDPKEADAKTSEMENGGDRSSQTMRAKLAAAREYTEKIKAVFR